MCLLLCFLLFPSLPPSLCFFFFLLLSDFLRLDPSAKKWERRRQKVLEFGRPWSHSSMAEHPECSPPALYNRLTWSRYLLRPFSACFSFVWFVFLFRKIEVWIVGFSLLTKFWIGSLPFRMLVALKFWFDDWRQDMVGFLCMFWWIWFKVIGFFSWVPSSTSIWMALKLGVDCTKQDVIGSLCMFRWKWFSMIDFASFVSFSSWVFFKSFDLNWVCWSVLIFPSLKLWFD